ncbi:hypothetical protein MY11210_003020 [Beauveria gryllotalpidicola]
MPSSSSSAALQGPARQMRFPATPATASSSSSPSAQKQQQPQEKAFTAEMRDRQSRGKDPYTKGDEEEEDDEEEEEEEEDDDDMDLDEDDYGSTMQIGNVPKNETFEERQRRQDALAVLDSPEQLMMYAQMTNDSIPGQRYQFMRTLCGFSDEEGEQQQQQQQQQARAARRR